MKYLLLFFLLIQIDIANAKLNRCEAMFSSDRVTHFDSRIVYSVIEKNKGPEATWSGWIVVLSNGVKGFFKTVNITLDKQRLVQAYQSPYHEVAAYKISELLGFNVVPETIMTKLNIGSITELGSLQLYVEGKTPDQYRAENGKYIYENDLIWLFDKIIANIDRSGGNYILTPDGQMRAIDNSSSFFTHNSLPVNLSGRHGPAIPAKFARVLRDNPRIYDNLKKVQLSELRLELEEYLWPSQIKVVYERIQTLLDFMKTVK